MQRWPTLLLAIIVGAECPLEETEPVAKRRQPAPERIRNPRFEPAHPAGADAAQDHAFSPCSRERLVHRMNTPDRQHLRCVPSANVNHVLLAEKLGQFGKGALEERQVRRRTSRDVEGAIESRDVVVIIAASRRNKAHLRLRFAREAQDEIVEPALVALYWSAHTYHT
jgi:hypothetical protein